MTVFSSREDREDGLDLRQLSFGDELVVSRLYFAVRDPQWRTIGLEIGERERIETASGFEMTVRATTLEPEFPMQVSLSYRAVGTRLDAMVDAVATGSFDYARIGFCVLLDNHTYTTRPTQAFADGDSWEFAFPDELVTPDVPGAEVAQFHRSFERLVTSTPSQTEIAFCSVGGERFEMEDQRNWSDASYKIYSVSDGWPHRASNGQRFHQHIQLRATAAVDPCRRVSGGGPGEAIELGEPVGPLPLIKRYAGRLSSRSLRPIGGFHELNSRRLTDLQAYDSIELPVNGSVHAADDDSVLEATRLHGPMAAQARALYPGLPFHMAPLSLADVAADWRDANGDYAAEPPPDLPAKRLLDPIAATWLIASVASAAPEQPDSLHYFTPTLPAGTPAMEALERLGELADATVLATTGPDPLAILALEVGDGVTLAIANTSPDACSYTLPDGERFTLEGFASRWHQLSGTASRRYRPTATGPPRRE